MRKIIICIYLLINHLKIFIQENSFIENNEILWYTYDYQGIGYYFTLSSFGKITPEPSVEKIKSLNFDFTSSTQIILLNNDNSLIFAASCTNNYLLEIIDISNNNPIIDYIEYSEIYEKTPYLCSISHFEKTIGIGYSKLKEKNLIMRFLIFNYDNHNVKYSFSQEINFDSSIGKYIDGNNKINIVCNMKGFCIYRDKDKGLMCYISDSNKIVIHPTKADFYIFYYERKHFIYFIDNSQLYIAYGEFNIEVSKINSAGYNIDFNSFSGSGYIDNNDLILIYSGNYGKSIVIERITKNGNEYFSNKLIELNNSNKYSKSFSYIYNDNNSHLLIKKDIPNSFIYDYFNPINLFELYNEYISINSKENEIILKAKSQQKEIKILIDSNTFQGLNDDNLIFYSINKKYNPKLDTEFTVSIDPIDNGIINYCLGKQKIENDELSLYINDCSVEFKIYICYPGCITCSNNNFIIENNNGICDEKSCKENYKYDINDNHICYYDEKICYDTCNDCYDGDFNEKKMICKNCKKDYIYTYSYNCIICDITKPYWYYNSEKKINECLYGNNNCPSSFPYLLYTGECINSCNNNLIYNENLKDCLEDKYFYVDDNKQIQYLDNELCDYGNYLYLIFNSKECVKKCPDNFLLKLYKDINSKICYKSCPSNYYLIENSKLCISDCNLINFKLINNECKCENGIIKKISDYDILCDTSTKSIINNIIETINNSNDEINSKEEIISSIEKHLEILKQLDNVIINIQDLEIKITNSSIIQDTSKKTKESSIDLGECETILKKHYNLDKNTPLITILINSPSKTNSLINVLNYKVYDQNQNELDLNLCSNVKLNVFQTITNEDSNVDIELIKYLSNEGINLFDFNSDFYQEKCFSFYINNSDITTKDRQNDIYNSVSICESNCNFVGYNEENKRVNCECSIKTKNEETIPKEETHNFFESINNQINYKLIKCNNAFKKFFKKFYKNIGFYFWFVSFISSIIGIIVYFCYSKDKLDKGIKSNFKIKKKKKIIKKEINISNPPRIRKFNEENIYSIDITNNNKLNEGEIDNDKIKYKKITPHIKIKRSKNKLRPKYTNDNIILTNYIEKSNSTSSILKSKETIDNKSSIRKLEISERNLISQVNLIQMNQNNEIKTFEDKKENSSYNNYRELFKNRNKDEDYWDLAFENAVYIDNRYFLSIFFSFLFTKIELISILFFPEQFQLYSITIPFYIFTLLFDFSLNALLYSDDIVSQKYSNDGKLAFITSFLLGLISNFITYLLMNFIKKLLNYSFAFSILKKEVKEEENYKNISTYLLKIVYQKFIIIFIIEFIIGCLCGYYLFIFCEIYKKSQMSLFINYIIGLITSLIISLIITLIVSILRKLSIVCKIEKLYYLSQLLADFI